MLEKRRRERGEGVNAIMETFIPMIRLKMKARAICERQVRAFRRSLPEQKKLMNDYLNIEEDRDLRQHPQKFYFR